MELEEVCHWAVLHRQVMRLWLDSSLQRVWFELHRWGVLPACVLRRSSQLSHLGWSISTKIKRPKPQIASRIEPPRQVNSGGHRLGLFACPVYLPCLPSNKKWKPLEVPPHRKINNPRDCVTLMIKKNIWCCTTGFWTDFYPFCLIRWYNFQVMYSRGNTWDNKLRGICHVKILEKHGVVRIHCMSMQSLVDP